MFRWLVAAALLVAVPAVAASSGAASGYRFLELPPWSPDGTKIEWASQPLDSSGSAGATIWIANPDGSSKKQLIGGLRNGLSEVVWPRPAMLLYDANFGVARLGLDRSHKVVMAATGSEFATDRRGDYAASSCDQCQAGPITVVNTSTGKRSTIGGAGTSNGDPAFSPDGTQIVFHRATYDSSSGRSVDDGLWIANRNGTASRSLHTAGGCAGWSPSGSLLAFLKPSPSGRGLALHTITPSGTHDRVLLARGPSCAFPAAYAWSPNGKLIAFEGGNGRTLMTVDVATGHTRTFARFKQVTGLAWSPSSKELLVIAPADCPSLWRVAVDGSQAVKVLSC